MIEEPLGASDNVTEGREEVGAQSTRSLAEQHQSDLEEGRRVIRNRTALIILELASHTLILGLALASLWLVHLILEALLGKDAKFFNYVPISWIIDVADLLVIGKFLWGVVRDFRRG